MELRHIDMFFRINEWSDNSIADAFILESVYVAEKTNKKFCVLENKRVKV